MGLLAAADRLAAENAELAALACTLAEAVAKWARHYGPQAAAPLWARDNFAMQCRYAARALEAAALAHPLAGDAIDQCRSAALELEELVRHKKARWKAQSSSQASPRRRRRTTAPAE